MSMKKAREDGQGLVEYALILILVSVVSIGILTVLGPQIGDAFSNVVGSLGGGPITSLTAVRTGNDTGNDVTVTVSVSESTSVKLSDSQSGNSTTISCSSTCSYTFSSVGFSGGTIKATAEGLSRITGYSAKK